MENQPNQNDELNSLEDPDTVAAPQTAPAGGSGAKKPGPKGLGHKLRRLITHLNIYALLFVLILVVAGGFTFVSIQKNKKAANTPTIPTQTLTSEELKQLNGSDATVGDAKQTLTVASNAIFAGKVLIRDSLDIAGGLKVGGSLSLPGITVSGTSSFDQIQGNKLAISGDASIQGQLTIQKGITVTGGGSFGAPITAPQITVQSFQLTGDLQLQRHIDAGGTTPSKSDGSALGAGGTTSISGTDTAGTVAINTGGGPGAGCFVTVTFTQKYNDTPHVVVTPIGSGAASLNYYVNRSNSSFSICATNSAPGGTNFSFDYVVID
ncbi:MAG TPA: hypothetical protein VLF87_03365 [Patescibacteria group bacterium]|nr:hypothetical protein [Patescibacteria group bacterium]